jgi:hypothetical protein
MACRTWPQSGWPPAPPGCGRRTPAWTPGSADQVLLRTPGSGWPGDGHGGPLERPVGRTPQFNVTVQPMGTDPVRTAAAKRRTPPAPSVRPCVWPAGHGQPRGVHVLALTGQDRTAMRMLPSANLSSYQHRDPSVVTTCTPCSMPERPQARSPSDVRAVVSGVHDGHPDRTGFRTLPAPSYPAGHRPLHPARHGKPEATRTGNRRTARKALGHPRSPRPQGGPPGHAEPPPVGPVFAVWQPRLARRWQDCQRDRNHGCDQAATWCRSTVQAAPRRTALLGSDGWRVERIGRRHPL